MGIRRTAKYNADLSRYEVTQHIDANGSVTGTSGKAYIKVQDKVSWMDLATVKLSAIKYLERASIRLSILE